MQRVVGIRFQPAGKLYYFAPGRLDVRLGDRVLAYTKQGLELGEVMLGPTDMQDGAVNGPLKRVVRKATPDDLAQDAANRRKADEAARICTEKIAQHNLPMKLIRAKYAFDRKRLVFFFTAENRVDFRKLVRELAGVFRTRIELRQVGVRDEAKMLGGLGPCGRALCCATHLRGFEPVAIRMAKSQGLSLNPAKISGVCGRLMCCLRYERDVYAEGRRQLPAVGSLVQTPEGEGEIVDVNVLREMVTVRIEDKGNLQLPPDRLRVLRASERAQADDESADEEELLPVESGDTGAADAPAEAGAQPDAQAEPAPSQPRPERSRRRRGKRRRGRRGRRGGRAGRTPGSPGGDAAGPTPGPRGEGK